MVIELTAKRLARVFGAIVIGLVSAHVVAQTIRFITGDDRLFGLVRLFGLGSERNLPTLYSGFAIFVCACLLLLVGYMTWRSERRWAVYWYVLSFVFAFLTLDEMLQVHERLIQPMQNVVDATGVLRYAWIIPYGIALLVMGFAYIRFLLHIPRRTAILFIIAGAMFVCGTIVLAMVSGVLYEKAYLENGATSLKILHQAVQTLEEVLEMSGIVVFMYAIADYIENSGEVLQLMLGRKQTAAPPA